MELLPFIPQCFAQKSDYHERKAAIFRGCTLNFRALDAERVARGHNQANRPKGRIKIDPPSPLECSVIVSQGGGKASVESVRNALGGRESFQFACTACGNCCKGGGEVYFTKQDLDAIFEYLGLKGAELARLRKALVQNYENGYYVHSSGEACILLDENDRCTVYPVRPLQCSSFPFWPSVFRNPNGIRELKSYCPGSRGKDPGEFSLIQTVRRVNETRKKFLEAQPKLEDQFML